MNLLSQTQQVIQLINGMTFDTFCGGSVDDGSSVAVWVNPLGHRKLLLNCLVRGSAPVVWDDFDIELEQLNNNGIDPNASSSDHKLSYQVCEGKAVLSIEPGRYRITTKTELHEAEKEAVEMPPISLPKFRLAAASRGKKVFRPSGPDTQELLDELKLVYFLTYLEKKITKDDKENISETTDVYQTGAVLNLGDIPGEERPIFEKAVAEYFNHEFMVKTTQKILDKRVLRQEQKKLIVEKIPHTLAAYPDLIDTFSSIIDKIQSLNGIQHQRFENENS